jgi:flagellar biosynthesis protein FlhF
MHMDLKTYRAATLAEAVAKLKGDLGPHALILHTRQIVERYCFGLRKRLIVEIVAGRNLPRRVQAKSQAPVAALLRRSKVPTQIVAPPETTGPLIKTATVSDRNFEEFVKELGQLRTEVGRLALDVRHQVAPQIPDELSEHFQNLKDNQVDADIAEEIIKAAHRVIRPEHLRNTDFVRDKLAEQVERLLTIAGPIARTRAGAPHVVALIGPTGVGKTTTIAKLAANLILKEKHSVGLITIDTYRIAAIDQLKRYADIIGAPLRVVANPDEIAGAVAAMRDREFVLIDTAGRSPSDTLKLSELRNFIQVAGADEVHAVLSATSSQPCIEHALERFGQVRIDRIIFTKLDETEHVGVLLNVLHKVNKPLSYVTTGQDVPDDIEVARGRRLAQLILGSKL